MNNIVNSINDHQRNRLHIALIAITTIASILISLYCLFSGLFIMFQNLFYIPIIFSCIYYTMRGFIYSVCLAVLYMLLILSFTSENGIIIQALVRVVLFIGIAGIVTFLSVQRKRLEKTLQKEREKFRTVADFTYDWVYWTDQQRDLIYVSPSCERISGYTPEEFMADAELIYHIVHPDDQDLLRRHVDEYHSLMANTTGDVEFRIVNRSNRECWIAHLCQPVYDSEGQFLGRCSSNRDITERKQAEKALKQSKRQLSDIIEFLPDATFVIDREGKVIAWNLAMEELTGVSKENIIGQGDHAYSIPFYGTRRRVLIDVIDTNDEDLTTKYKYVRRKGNMLYGEAFVQALYGGKGAHIWGTAAAFFDDSGNPVGTIESIRDITEHKETEQALQESEEKYRVLFEGSVHGILVADNETSEFIYANPSICRMFGYSEAALLQLGITKIHPKDSLDYVMSEFRSLIGGKKAQSSAVPCLRKDGTIFYADIAVADAIIRERRCSVGFFADITDRKLAEDKINALLSEKELLLREVHHRIKNNMNVVMSLLSLQSGALEDNPSAIAALEDSRNRVQSMMILYDKLYRSTDFREISTKEYLTSLINEILSNFPNRDLVTIETHIDDCILDAKILSPVGMILNELLTNIMKHAFIGRESGVIEVSFSFKDNHATLSIQDNGVGIPESINITTSTGFGMQLVGLLTQQLEGTIRIERENGTRFVLEFEV